MRVATAIVIVLLLAGLASAGLYAHHGDPGTSGTLTEQWVSDTGRETTGNHHHPAVAQIDGETTIVVPVNSDPDQGDCALVALDATGSARWQIGMPSTSCNVHGFGSPTIADADGDDVDEVLVATTEESIAAYDTQTRARKLHHDLTGWGYSRPIVANVTESSGPETVVVDLEGDVLVLSAQGERVWNVSLARSVTDPEVADFDGDGRKEIAVGTSDGVTVLGSNGTTRWDTPIEGTVNWMTTGDTDRDGVDEIVVGTNTGEVIAIDGSNGSIEWRRDVGDLAAVDAIGDGDGDGRVEVYATERGGALLAIDGRDGTVEWTSTLTREDAQMTPPPVIGDLDGDGDLELVATTLSGVVSIVDPSSGDVLDTYQREVPIWTSPELEDVDRDGDEEVLVVYGDGRIAALEFE